MSAVVGGVKRSHWACIVWICLLWIWICIVPGSSRGLGTLGIIYSMSCYNVHDNQFIRSNIICSVEIVISER